MNWEELSVSTKQYEAVIFDLDGTLVDSMWIWKDIDEAYLIKHGYTLPPELQKEIEGMSTTETATYFKNRFDIEDSVEDIKSEWIAMAHDYYAHKIPLKSGAKEFMHKLHKNGVKLGVGTSNFREMTELVLKKHEVMGLVTSIRTSCEVEKGKPNPDVFLKVAEDLDVHPSKCLVFEDTHAGVIAANRAGMDVIAVYDDLSAPYKREIESDSIQMIKDFNELCIL